jgi:hypothetical protein
MVHRVPDCMDQGLLQEISFSAELVDHSLSAELVDHSFSTYPLLPP